MVQALFRQITKRSVIELAASGVGPVRNIADR
jgi:hypothetical protein